MYNLADFEKKDNKNKFNYTQAGALSLGTSSIFGTNLLMDIANDYHGDRLQTEPINNNNDTIETLINEENDEIFNKKLKDVSTLTKSDGKWLKNEIIKSRNNKESFKDFKNRFVRKSKLKSMPKAALGAGLIGAGVGAGLGYGVKKLNDFRNIGK